MGRSSERPPRPWASSRRQLLHISFFLVPTEDTLNALLSPRLPGPETLLTSLSHQAPAYHTKQWQHL
jgi:hypothetical protein